MIVGPAAASRARVAGSIPASAPGWRPRVDHRERRGRAELAAVRCHRHQPRPRRDQPLHRGVVGVLRGEPRLRVDPAGAEQQQVGPNRRERLQHRRPERRADLRVHSPPSVTSRSPSRSTSAAAIAGAWVTTVTPLPCSRSAQASVVVPASMNTVIPGSTSRASAAPRAAFATGASRALSLTGPAVSAAASAPP